MNIEKLSSIVSGIVFAVALLLMMLAVVEKFMNAVGYTIVSGEYAPSRLLEIAAVLLLLVMVFSLKQLRNEVMRRNTKGAVK